MVYVNYVKFNIHIVIGALPPILAIYSNIVIWFINAPVSKVVKSTNMTSFGVPSFSVSAILGSIYPPSLDFWKDRRFLFL